MKFVIYEVLLTSIGPCNLLVASAVLNLRACVCMGGFLFFNSLYLDMTVYFVS